MDSTNENKNESLLFSFSYTSNGLSSLPAANVAVHIYDTTKNNRPATTFYGYTPFLSADDFVIGRDILRHHLECYPPEMISLTPESMNWALLTPQEAEQLRIVIDMFLTRAVEESRRLRVLPSNIHWESGTYNQLKKKRFIERLDRRRSQDEFVYWLIENAFSVSVMEIFGLVIPEVLAQRGVIPSIGSRLYFQLPCATASGNTNPERFQSVLDAVAHRKFATSCSPAVPFIDPRERTPCAATRLYAVKTEAHCLLRDLATHIISEKPLTQSTLGSFFSATGCAREVDVRSREKTSIRL